MTVYVLVEKGTDNVLMVCDADLLAHKRKLYFEGVYGVGQIKIVEKSIEYIDRD